MDGGLAQSKCAVEVEGKNQGVGRKKSGRRQEERGRRGEGEKRGIGVEH